ncbi:helix-turn-helix domain-containing protein [Oligoflexus tunisiensis]|uniref:helix-turn-helix domain-containing protein n=1 Tax=Oligoflexus tunisiensis TaxID=708132 RepID=UPI00159F2287|nr:helix-turn-helix domain-containing protein [Oligoflexus tunisiensis]
MSNAQLSYNSPDHPVFSGGRYLRAFDHLHDIDHYEHSILTYLGSLMPFDKGFIDHPAFPSIATIARSTKISESTVRKKLRSLESKNYLKTKTVRFLNTQGKFQQSSNDYSFTTQAFDTYTDVLASRNQIKSIRRRSSLTLIHTPPLSSQGPSPRGSRTTPHREPLPNSLKDHPKDNPKSTASCSDDRDIFTMKSEVDRIVEVWEDVTKKPVTKGQKETFLQQYVRIRGHEIFYMERLLRLASDSYLLGRAHSINFLFSGFDMAEKDKRDITQKVDQALSMANSQAEIQEIMDQIPSFVVKKSHNYIEPWPSLMAELFQYPFAVHGQGITH